MYEGIYLVQEREFIKTNEDVYKIGKSNNLSQRVRGYPKGSRLLLLILCKNVNDIEKK
jgi:excinuclease UvrABC nuclease subunit